MNAHSADVGARLKSAAIYGGTLTAAGAGDATEVTSDGIDTDGFGSGVIVIAGRTNTASGQTLKFTVKVSESDDNSSYGADDVVANAVTVVNGAASAQNFVYEVDVKLVERRKRYVKIKITPDISTGSVDTAQWGAALVMGGSVTAPV
jgi:hypothetical protein